MDDFIVSAHALERFEERFPSLYKNDEQAATFIHNECTDAVTEGRISSVAPLELSNYDLRLWRPDKSRIAWSPLKTRGYVLTEDTEGQVVVTVLRGESTESVRRKLYLDEKPSRLKGDRDEASDS